MKKPIIEPAKLKYFSLVSSIATIGCFVAFCISANLWGNLAYCVFPGLLIAFTMISQEQREFLAKHNIGYIVLYVVFGLYNLSSAYMIYASLVIIFSGALFQTFFWWIYIGCVGCQTISSLAGFFYYHTLRQGVVGGNSENTQPLIENNA